MSIGKRQRGETAAEVTEMMMLIFNAGELLTRPIIVIGIVLSSPAAKSEIQSESGG